MSHLRSQEIDVRADGCRDRQMEMIPILRAALNQIFTLQHINDKTMSHFQNFMGFLFNFILDRSYIQ